MAKEHSKPSRRASQITALQLSTPLILPDTPHPDIESSDSFITKRLEDVPIIPFDCEDKGPGPYKLPTLIGYKDHDITKHRGPAYTIGVKRPSFSVYGDEATPGPGGYETRNMTHHGAANSPAAKIRSRPPIKSVYDDEEGPGPTHYSPEKYLDAVYRRAPKASVKGRTRSGFSYAADETPGPTYDPERVMGPNLPTRTSAPAARVKGRPPDSSVYSENEGPGPGHYNLGSVDKIKMRSPSAALGNVWPGTSVYEQDDLPAPNAYLPNLDSTAPRRPNAFLGIKHSPCEARNVEKSDVWSLVDF